MKKYKKEIIVSSLAVLLFVSVVIFVFAIGSNHFDTQIFHFFEKLRNNFSIGFFKFITFFGGKIFTIILAFLSFIFLINRDQTSYKKYVKNEKLNNIINLLMPCFIFILSILLVTILFLIMKAIFARPRPYEWFLIDEDGWSFPSGHTATSFAMFCSLACIFCRNLKKRKQKIILISGSVLFSWLIGCSRIFLGVHYATDVLAGACLGVIAVIITSILLKHTKTKVVYKTKK